MSTTEAIAVDVTVSVGTSTMENGLESTPVLLSLRPPEAVDRVPTDIICVIDASYSMNDEATVQNEPGSVAEGKGFTILDVTKHAVRTVFNVLEPNDRLSIVSFADNGLIDLELTAMDDAGKDTAEKCLDKLVCRGGTNLWAGVEKGLEVAASSQTGQSSSLVSNLSSLFSAGQSHTSNRLAHVLLLTDGVPTCNPPKGAGTEVEMLWDYKNSKGGQLPCTLTTFGFGYNLKSKMLTELAELGDGSYAFIPDAGMVGTVFVNTMSNLLATMARSVVLRLQSLGNSEFDDEPDNSEPDESKTQKVSFVGSRQPCVLGGHLATFTQDKKLEVCVGTLQFGQNKDVVVRMRLGTSQRFQLPSKKTPFGRYKDKTDGYAADTANNVEDKTPYLCATLTYMARNHEGAPTVYTTKVDATSRSVSADVAVQIHRLNAAQSISKALALTLDTAQSEQASTVISDLVSSIRSSSSASDDRVQSLLEDLEGQVSEALSRQDYFKKWGQHYLPSIRLAHLHQQCNNFKDPGVQHYAGDFFTEIRDAADEIFIKLPPPKPSRRASVGGSTAAPVRDMTMFYNVGGGCFHGECCVLMADGSQKPLNLVKQGDQVMTHAGDAEVACVVKTLCTGGCAELVELPGGLLATPYHPVCVARTWRFPCDLANRTLRSCPAVYNLALQGKHSSIWVSGVECAVLGHGLEDPVVKHEYFGTERIIEDLKSFPAWENGLIELIPQNYVRDPSTGQVCGLTLEPIQDKELLSKADLLNFSWQTRQAFTSCGACEDQQTSRNERDSGKLIYV
jgi:Mg-chelatase subunit ChlD